jgi:hypothetical protein
MCLVRTEAINPLQSKRNRQRHEFASIEIGMRVFFSISREVVNPTNNPLAFTKILLTTNCSQLRRGSVDQSYPPPRNGTAQ